MTITEGDDIPLIVERCVVEDHSDGSFTKHCQNQSNPDPGVVAPTSEVDLTGSVSGSYGVGFPRVTFSSMEFRKDFEVTTTDNQLDQFNGSLTVEIEGGTYEGQSLDFVIQDNDGPSVWIYEIQQATEGDVINFTLRRAGATISITQTLTVSYVLEFVDPNQSVQIVPTTTQTATFEANERDFNGSVATSENDFVHGDVQVRLKLIAGDTSVYQIDRDSAQPSSATTTVSDNDEYSLFVELPSGQASTVQEGSSIQLLFKRCVLLDDESTNCTDPSTITGAIAPTESHSIYLSSAGNYFSNPFPGHLIFGSFVQTITLTINTVDDQLDEIDGS